jgi:hypothetical protein
LLVVGVLLHPVLHLRRRVAPKGRRIHQHKPQVGKVLYQHSNVLPGRRSHIHHQRVLFSVAVQKVNLLHQQLAHSHVQRGALVLGHPRVLFAAHARVQRLGQLLQRHAEEPDVVLLEVRIVLDAHRGHHRHHALKRPPGSRNVPLFGRNVLGLVVRSLHTRKTAVTNSTTSSRRCRRASSDSVTRSRHRLCRLALGHGSTLPRLLLG